MQFRAKIEDLEENFLVLPFSSTNGRLWRIKHQGEERIKIFDLENRYFSSVIRCFRHIGRDLKLGKRR